MPITQHVYWVGAIDWNIRDFHGYSTPRGTTYNAYLIVGDKITLVDTVKAPFRSEMLARIASVVDPREISYIISNHSEMDHTGCLADMMELAKPVQVFASAAGVKALDDHFRLTDGISAVKNGETIHLGGLTLTFTETRMLHWPDSMTSYLAEDGVLFSQDTFGMHLASRERFADEIETGVLEWEAAKYYANILSPFSPRVTKLAERLKTISPPQKVIAPDHGPLWRQDLSWIVDRYTRWALHPPTRKAVVTFDTMWNSTERLAESITEGLAAGGATVKFMPLRISHRSDIATELLDAGALLVGSPTLNDQLFPTVADLLTYLKGLKPAHLVGVAFGSFGWSGSAVDAINAALDEMKVKRVGDGLKIKYVPDAVALRQGYELGLAVADELAKATGS